MTKKNFNTAKVNLVLYDSKGSEILKSTFQINNSLFYLVHTERFAPGVYFIKIQTDNGIKFAKKIVKQ